MAEQDDLQGLIVIKRRLNTDPEMPKGGVWKIAFADFMTAMMCFFLVMWLINAANEDTRQAVAAYFNPIRLTDLNRKGLDNPHIPPADQPQDGERTKDESKPGAAPPAEAEPHLSRDALFSDPYKVLTEIAAEHVPAAGAGGVEGTGAGAGAVFRDPFDAEIRDVAAAPAPEAVASAAGDGDKPGGAEKQGVSAGTAAADAAIAEGPDAAPSSAPPPAPPAAADASMSLPPGAAPPAPIIPPGDSSAASIPPGAPAKSDIGAAIDEVVREEGAGGSTPKVVVESTGEGTLISLTDDVDFGMFAIGSAEPQPELVRVMQRIGAILKDRAGTITIRGHTDSRPFRGGNYDNWRLSTDRAQMAYYMLVRGGLDEKRVEAIEGYADRKPRNPSDPEGAENRRIEILVREAS